jgi:FkbH-like protein
MSDVMSRPDDFIATLWADFPLETRFTIEPDVADLFLLGTRIIAEPPPENALKIAIAGAATTDFLARAIAFSCLQEGIAPSIQQAPFGAYNQELLDPNSALYRFAPNIVVLVLQWRDYIAADLPLSATEAEVAAVLDAKAAMFETYWSLIEARTGARIIQHLVAPPAFALAGIAEQIMPASISSQIASLNHMLLHRGAGRVCFIDIPRLAATHGAAQVLAPAGWYSAKLPFSVDALPAYVAPFRAALRNVTNRAKKVLVLDLDNTLWGGVIGDDGVAGLRLGPGEAVGEAFADFQAYVKLLSARGVILAVCSKNNPETAASGFTHQFSALKRTDFAAFECSWNDKAGGLRRIAAALNLGADSMVFADDNPAECALVRAALPEVAVVELGHDPAQFIAKLDAGRWFEMQVLNDTDLKRAASYQARAAMLAEQQESADLGGFLLSLKMTGKFFPPEPSDIARIAQLSAKTNQFNLTTRRYGEADIRAFLNRADSFIRAFTLTDRFADHGLVAAVVGVAEDGILRIDEWLMSCRVFSRSAEQAMMREILKFAAAHNFSAVQGEYLPTAKNSVVADLYPRLGFTETGAGLWRRSTAQPLDDLVTQIELLD